MAVDVYVYKNLLALSRKLRHLLDNTVDAGDRDVDIMPVPVQVGANDVAPVVPQDHTVGVQHGYHAEQVLLHYGCVVRGCYKRVQYPFHNIASLRLPGVNSSRDKNNLFRVAIAESYHVNIIVLYGLANNFNGNLAIEAEIIVNVAFGVRICLAELNHWGRLRFVRKYKRVKRVQDIILVRYIQFVWEIVDVFTFIVNLTAIQAVGQYIHPVAIPRPLFDKIIDHKCVFYPALEVIDQEVEPLTVRGGSSVRFHENIVCLFIVYFLHRK